MILGYKTRRIYFNSEKIQSLRVEYRDLIQFAFSLSTEKDSIAKETLSQTLLEIQATRKQFIQEFELMFESSNWALSSQPKQI